MVEINGSSLNPLILSIIDIQVGNLVGNKSVVLHRAKVFGEILCPTPLVGIYREKEFTQIVIFHIPPSALKQFLWISYCFQRCCQVWYFRIIGERAGLLNVSFFRRNYVYFPTYELGAPSLAIDGIR